MSGKFMKVLDRPQRDHGAPGQRRIAILVMGPIDRDVRVQRQIAQLSRRFDVVAFGWSGTRFGEWSLPREPAATDAPPSSERQSTRWLRRFVPDRGIALLRWLYHGFHRAGRTACLVLGKLGMRRGYEWWFWYSAVSRSAVEMLVASRPDAIHANDADSLLIAVAAARRLGVPVVLDLHEHQTRQFEERWTWRVLWAPAYDYALRTYLPHVRRTVTVCDSLADAYCAEYGCRPLVVRNLTSPGLGGPANATNPETIHLVHHGRAMRDRKLERMIHTMAQTEPRFRLHLVLLDGPPGYLDELKALAERVCPGRVSFHEPVPVAQVVSFIAQFDVGFYLLPPTNINTHVSLPNKFFDFVAAGLAVVVGPSPEMARLTEQYGFGRVAPSFDPADAASLLNSLSAADIDAMKARAIEAAKELNPEVEFDKLVRLYEELLDKSPAPVPGAGR
jgi:glycosyltransferase involved in cell wall biosynthesis